MFTMAWGKVYTNYHGYPLFPLPNPSLTSVFDPSSWVYDNDIDRVSDEDAPLGHGEDIGGDGGNVGGSGVGLEGGSAIPGSFGANPIEEEEYTLLMTRSQTKEGSLGFDATHFYQYMDDHFSCLNLRIDAIYKR